MSSAAERKLFRRMSAFLPEVCAAVVFAVFFVFPSSCTRGASEGVELCLNIAVPSLFPMMFAAVLTVETGLADRLGRLTSGVGRLLFGLDGAAFTAVILALTGGFPAGAKAVSRLYERGCVSRRDAQRMVLFCFSAGPAFLMGTVAGFYDSTAVGLLLLCVQAVSVVAIGMLSRLLPHGEKEKTPGNCTLTGFPEAMTAAAAQTASAMLNICLFIIIFNILRAILDDTGAMRLSADFFCRLGVQRSTAETVLPVVLEVTSGCAAASRAGIPMTAFAVGFGGLAVHMQVMSIAKNVGMNYPLFLAARLMQGMLCALLAKLGMGLMPQQFIAVSEVQNTVSSRTAPVGTVMLIVMSAMLAMCAPELKGKRT